jgi:hypothetical protein
MRFPAKPRLWTRYDFLVVAGLVIVAVVIIVRLALGSRVAVEHDDARRLRDYCGMVHFALEQDAIELSSANPATRARAGNRFAEQVTGHSAMEIQLCASRPVDLTGRQSAWLELRYDLLAVMARNAADATEIQR